MLMFACPIRYCSIFMSIHFSSILVQNVCLMVCADMDGNVSSCPNAFIALTIFASTLFTEHIKSGLPFLVMKTKPCSPSTSNTLRSFPSREFSSFCCAKAFYTLSDIGIVLMPDFVFRVLTWILSPTP